MSSRLYKNSWNSLYLNALLPNPENVSGTLKRLGEEILRRELEVVVLLERSTLVFGDAIREAIPKHISIHTIDIAEEKKKKTEENAIDNLKIGTRSRVAVVDEYISFGRQT